MKMKRIQRPTVAIATAVGLVLLLGCGGDSPTGPALPFSAVAGLYDLGALTFDPAGSLPAMNIKPRLTGVVAPQLNLSNTGTAQLVFRDPVSGEFKTAAGKYTTGDSTVTITWNDNEPYGLFLLSKRMSYQFSTSGSGGVQLSFSGTSPDGVSRARLVGLVPEWQDEQLFDPVPGTLSVVFTLSGS